MFGNKEKKIESLIKKGNWDVLMKKFLHADTSTKVMLAKGCANSKDPGVNSLLTSLIRDTDYNVRLEAVKAIAVTGKEHEVAQLQWLLDNTPENETEMISAIHTAISNSKGRR